MYLLMKQNLKENEKSIPEDEFFSSFQFIPYVKSKFDTYKSDDDEFTALLPDKPRVIKDSSYKKGAYLNYTKSY